MDKKQKAINNYVAAERAMYQAAHELQMAVGLTEEDTDPVNGWTLTMWLFQAPLYSHRGVEKVITQVKESK